MLKEIFEKRKEFKKEYQRNPNQISKARNNAFKLLSAAVHGYIGFFGARYYSLESSASILAFVRKFNKDIIKKTKKEGFKIAYSPSLKVFQTRRDNLKDFVKQIFYYGTARPNKEKFSETLKMPSYLVPPLFLLYLVLLPALYFVSKWFLAPLALYVLLSIIFSSYESTKNKDFLAFFILPFMFLVIHLSYGLGFIVGLFTRTKR